MIVKNILKIPDHSGPAIYALVDQNGKRYIGSSCNLQRRIKEHDREIRRVLRGENSGFLSNSLTSAVLMGLEFKVEVLATYENMDSKNLLKIERACLLAAGGLQNTYNSQAIKLHRIE